MPRYIYADDIKNAIEGVTRTYLSTLSTTDTIDSVTAKWLYKRLKTLVDEMPTADVVPIVRCKDCKHYGDDHFCCYPWCTDPEEFCSRGERREE